MAGESEDKVEGGLGGECLYIIATLNEIQEVVDGTIQVIKFLRNAKFLWLLMSEGAPNEAKFIAADCNFLCFEYLHVHSLLL